MKEFLHRRGVPFTERDVSTVPGAAQEAVRLSGQMGVPVTRVGGAVVIGFDPDRLTEALAAAEMPRGSTPSLGLEIQQGDRGPEIRTVAPGGPADQAGLRSGDRLVSLAGIQVDSEQAVAHLVPELLAGQPLPVVVERQGQRLEVALPL